MAASTPASGPPDRSERRRRWPWLLLAVAGLVAALVLALANPGWLRGPVEHRIEAATGRDAGIAALDVDWGWPPRVLLSGVSLANADWGADRPMLVARRIAFDLAPGPLLRGELVLPRLELDRPDLLLERDREGRA